MAAVLSGVSFALADLLKQPIEHPFRTTIAIGGLYLRFWVVRAVYRIFFHPLARYPGSPLAAASKEWYEWYWNFHQKGLLLFEIERQHQRHGPVVRVGPNELHINDPEVFQDMTKVGSRFTKDPNFYDFITFPGTSIGETDPARHRIRRLVLTPAFSPSRVQQLAPMIQEKVDQLLRRFEDLSSRREPINMFMSCKAFTMDIISKIVFGQELGCIQDPNFRNQFIEYLHSAFEMGWTATAFPNLTRISLAMPPWLSTLFFPIPILEFKKKCLILINSYLRERNAPVVGDEGKQAQRDEFSRSVVIDMLVDPSATKDHSVLNANQLAEEVIMLLSAGNDTTSDAMIIGIYQILNSRRIYDKLHAELAAAFPTIYDNISYEKARKLPYLNAVIKEFLRFSHPLPGRLPRVVPPEGYRLYDHSLPSGVVINTSAYLLNRHPKIWSNPDKFIPERWMGPDAGRLDKYMTSFYRGTRQCLGKDLAWCELYLLLANLFRKFELELFNTSHKDMEWIDLLLIHFTGKNFHARMQKRKE